MLKQVLEYFLPRKLFLFIRARPRPIIISNFLYKKIKTINTEILYNEFENRGDKQGGIRKYAHIIDKGLQSPSREAGHGNKTYTLLLSMLSSVQEDTQTEAWGKLIAKKYEELQAKKLNDYKNFEFLNSNKIQFNNLRAHLTERRSIRHFEERAVETTELHQLLELARWAPSSCNRQTIRLYATTNEEIATACARQNNGATNITGTYAFVCVCYDSRSYHYPHEAFTGIVDTSLAFSNIVSGAHSLGLGGCVLNWSNSSKKQESELRELLSIQQQDVICFNFLVGHPKYGAPTPGKKSDNEFISIIK